MRTALAVLIACVWAGARPCAAAPPATTRAAVRADGYRGIWYMNQPQADAFKYKYSGGFGTYPQQHVPLAIYAAAVDKTFFCYGGRDDDANEIRNLVSVYDHATGTVPRPAVVLRRATNDTHYNPTLGMDAAGHVYVFCNSHGAGYELSKDDPTHGGAFIYRSTRPYSIDAFERVYAGNFSYSQPWTVAGRGMLWLHTRYAGNNRRLFFATSEDGRTWSEPRPLVRIRQGSYQISWGDGRRIATAFDHHPDKGHLNARTNLYYLETRDLGQTWTTVDGKPVTTPLTDVQNPALVRDYEKEGLLVYLKDLAFDADGRPVVLYLTAKGYKSGPDAGPRVWYTARWTGDAWEYREAARSDHNYDHGSLYVEADGAWRLIAPTEPGPQPGTTGGQVTVRVSKDRGQTWAEAGRLAIPGGRNQTYVRRPVNAAAGFYAYWADGDALQPSASSLYFMTKDGAAFRLPERMTADTARPEAVGEVKPR